MGKTKGDTFPHSFTPPLSFRLVLTAFENFEFLLFCLLNGFQVLFRVKQVVKNIAQRSALGLDSCEWQVVWDSKDKCLGEWTPLVFLKLTPQQVQNPYKLVKYLEEVCCHPGNSRETQITATCWGLAQAYRALFHTVQCSKGKGGGNKATGTVASLAPLTALKPLWPRRLSQPPQSALWLPLPQHRHCPSFPSGHSGFSSSGSRYCH